MKNVYHIIFMGIMGFALLSFSLIQAQAAYPYTSGQAVFVQSPYNSSLYTNYDYNSRQGTANRLPAYTTNQAVFVQKPYVSQQTVTAFPSTDYSNLPSTESRYTSPSAFPSTVAPPYPYTSSAASISGRYTTTTQNPTYNYPYPASSYTSTSSYPYTSTTPITNYPSTTIQQQPVNSSPNSQIPIINGQYYQTIPSAQKSGLKQPINASSVIYNNAYPVTTVSQYPYPTTTTATPETIIQSTSQKK
ncbi:hypothetical protein [Candidatus Protochlamydia sp. R18]|uniref:hypothetical protein n=1 Tax=Candidatus Protochlamydia sp. R18 TaxID=1353977 RepID=UPI0005AB62E7|nr:hypothetical protein [Candidatus Protochlamydia sp. R18]